MWKVLSRILEHVPYSGDGNNNSLAVSFVFCSSVLLYADHIARLDKVHLLHCHDVSVAVASDELISIFYDNETMLRLYMTALTNPTINPGRLRKTLRCLFKAYSKHLLGEATDQFEDVVARLVAIKSQGLVDFIVENLRTGSVHWRALDSKYESDGSDEESKAHQVDAEALVDMYTFRKFLIESKAFVMLQAKLQAFVLPRPPKSLSHEQSRGEKISQTAKRSQLQDLKAFIGEDFKSKNWQCWRRDAVEAAYASMCNSDGLPTTTLLLFLLVDLVFLMTDATFTNMGLLEPPLHPSKIRLRWSSVCVTLAPLL
jgi:hypothetical protein